MAKFALLLPEEDLLIHAKEIIKNDKEIEQDIVMMKVVKTNEVISDAREAISKGATIIIARGLQARLVMENTKIPVVEITLSTQDIGLLIKEAKKIVKKSRPKIGMIAFPNMIGDITYINELFDVDFVVYNTINVSDFENSVKNAIDDNVDIVIGGHRVLELMEKYSVPYLFSKSTHESLLNAIDVTKKMSYTADVQNECNAQVETVFDTAFNGIIKINNDKEILLINKMMEELLQKSADMVVSKNLYEVINIDEDLVNRVMNNVQETALTSINIKDTPVMVMIAPIKFNHEITGAIVSCHKLKNIISSKSETVQKMYLSGYIAKGDFKRFYSKDKKMITTIELAKKYSLSKFPVLIYCDDETEANLFAQSIHNNSRRKNAPFVEMNCANLSAKEQMEKLFGEVDDDSSIHGLIEKADYGTFYIEEVDKLCSVAQHKLFQILTTKNKVILDNNGTNYFDVRIIFNSKRELKKLVDKGSFRKDLYYAISALVIDVPPLYKRPEDIFYLVTQYFKEFTENYSRYLTITNEAMKKIVEHKWEGGVVQLEAFCERMFLSANKKNIDEIFVNELLEELYPNYIEDDGQQKIVVYRQKEAEELIELLQKHSGNRQKVANELGISTTTLWRKIKKYEIGDNY